MVNGERSRMSPVITDLGHVKMVRLWAGSGMEALRTAERIVAPEPVRNVRVEALRARLLDQSPDPESWPSEFEVLVSIKELA